MPNIFDVSRTYTMAIFVLARRIAAQRPTSIFLADVDLARAHDPPTRAQNHPFERAAPKGAQSGDRVGEETARIAFESGDVAWPRWGLVGRGRGEPLAHGAAPAL